MFLIYMCEEKYNDAHDIELYNNFLLQLKNNPIQSNYIAYEL